MAVKINYQILIQYYFTFTLLSSSMIYMSDSGLQHCTCNQHEHWVPCIVFGGFFNLSLNTCYLPLEIKLLLKLKAMIEFIHFHKC
jgi:hypothetical protein